MTPILMHSEAVPEGARAALRAAFQAPAEARATELESAARALYRETDLECADVRDLVGLPAGECHC